MTQEEGRELGRSLVDAYNRRDIGKLGELIEDAAVWHSSRGDETGRAKILALLTSVHERSGGTFRLELHDVLVTEDHLIVLTRAHGRRDSKTIDDPDVTVFHIRDGRVGEAWAFAFDQQARASFWS
jgi:uncharacterized protein